MEYQVVVEIGPSLVAILNTAITGAGVLAVVALFVAALKWKG